MSEAERKRTRSGKFGRKSRMTTEDRRMTSPSADTMERARAALSAALRDPRCGTAVRMTMIQATHDAFTDAIAQALHDAQEEARREQREKDAAEIEARAECFNPGWVRTVLEGLAYRFRNRESST